MSLMLWRAVVARNVVAFRRQWAIFLSGFLEPVPSMAPWMRSVRLTSWT